MAVNPNIVKKTCDIYVCKKIKTVGLQTLNNGIDWIQTNSTSTERDELIAAYQSRDAYLIGRWWKKKMEQYLDQLYRPTCEGYWADDTLNESEVTAIFDNADDLGCFTT